MARVNVGERPVERCQGDPDCPGARLQGGHCLEHLTPDELKVVVTGLRAGEPLDARATTVSAKRLQALLDSLCQGKRPVLPAADFRRATFSGTACFGAATFSDIADFAGATFSEDVDFDGTNFRGGVDFRGATFCDIADFAGATFCDTVAFGGAIFRGDAGFVGATFRDIADFGGASFVENVGFGGATFRDIVRFGGATFRGYTGFGGASFNGAAAGFDRAIFRGPTRFSGASFSGTARFAGAAFERTRELGPFVVGQQLVLDDCVFVERIRLEVAARVISARATTFADGALIRVRWAEIAVDDADFARPSTVSGATTWRTCGDLEAASLVDDRHIELEPRPRLMTLRGAHVAALSLSNVDLRPCRFFGAHGLESLSVEASCRWPRSPARRLRVTRETIAEEHAWRGWSDPATRPPAWLQDRDRAQPLSAAQIAALYRALRKAREEDKDQPGAGDLYYGEMEMRRHSKADDLYDSASHTNIASPPQPSRTAGDTAILYAYWLVSGYGLRPARALAALALTLLAGAALLLWFGFHEPHTYGRSVLFATLSALNVLRPSQNGLSAGGEIVQISLRLLGPLLFGLALLAVRARVKR